MRTCPHCGNELEDFDVMCGKCGEEVTQQTETSTSTTNTDTYQPAYTAYGQQNTNENQSYQPYGAQNTASSQSYQPYGAQNTASSQSYQPYGAQNTASSQSYQPYGAQNTASSQSYQPYGAQNTASSQSYQPYGEQNTASSQNYQPYGAQNASSSQSYQPYGEQGTTQNQSYQSYGTQNQNTYPGTTGGNTGYPKKKKGILPTIIVIMVLCVIGVAWTIYGKMGERGIAQKTVEAVFKMDFNQINKYYAFDVDTYLKENGVTSSDKNLMKMYMVNMLQEKFGKNYKLSYSVIHSKKISKSQYENIMEIEDIFFGDMSDYIDVNDITQMKKVRVRIDAKGSKDKRYGIAEVYVIKLKGKSGWKTLLVDEKE